jgi:RNA polymerase sigma-70 factor (sigma-E family)
MAGTGSTRDREFVDFVTARRGGLLATARLLTAGDVHAAEDLVQVALVHLYSAWSRIRQDGNPEAYARRVLVNAAVDESRRPWRRREHLAAVLPDGAGSPGEHGPDGIQPDETAVIRAALAALPPRMRAVVVLRYWLDYDVRETASVLGCSEGTVKSQSKAGLDRLRQLLPHAAGAVEGGDRR